MSIYEVTHICKRTVVSTKPVQPGKYHDLSVYDHLMQNTHLKIVFYYPSSTTRGIAPGETTRRLRESLAEMLTYYPVVTGRLVKKKITGRWMIKCNDAGVRMVEKKAKGSIEEWLKFVDRAKELQLVHWEDMFHDSYFWATFYVQVTEFECGGFAVGLSCTHLLADLTCATMFIKAWADVNLAQKMSIPPFFHPLPPRRPGNKDPNHKPYTALIAYYKSCINIPINSVKHSNHKTIMLAFSDQMVKACMDMAQNGTSPFEALAGLFWASISKVKGIKNGLISLSLFLDMRKVLGLDKGLFGNCMIYNPVQSESSDDENMNFAQAAEAVKKVVAQMDSEGIMNLIEWLERNDHESPSFTNGCDHLICASLDNVDPYLSMYEDGVSPIRISCYMEPMSGLGQILILPTPPGNGPMSRVVMVTLANDEAMKLCEDDLILRFSPLILMGTQKFSS